MTCQKRCCTEALQNHPDLTVMELQQQRGLQEKRYWEILIRKSVQGSQEIKFKKNLA